MPGNSPHRTHYYSNKGVLFVINLGHYINNHFVSDKNFSPFAKDEEEVILPDSQLLWITEMKEEEQNYIIQQIINYFQ